MHKIVLFSFSLIISFSIWAQKKQPFSNETIKLEQWEGVLFTPYAKGKFETINHGFLSNYCDATIKNAANKLLHKMKSFSEKIILIEDFNPPQGINITYSIQVNCNTISEFNQLGLTATTELRFNALIKDEGADENSEIYTLNTNNSAYQFYFNDCIYLINSVPIVDNVFLEPVKVDEFMNSPVFEMQRNTGKYIVFTKSTKPLWVPVSVQEYIEKHIAYFQTKIDNLKSIQNSQNTGLTFAQQFEAEKKQRKIDFEITYKALLNSDKNAAADFKSTYEETEKLIAESIKNNPELQNKPGDEYNSEIQTYKGFITDLQNALDSFSKVEREQAAYWSSGIDESSALSIHTGLVKAESADAHPLVKINPNLLDKSKDKSDIQLIVVHINGIPDNASKKDGYYLEGQFLIALKNEKKFWESLTNLLSDK